jgi:hypothetical protein
VLLSSSYTGFGICTLRTDAQELDSLIRYLKGSLHSEAIGIIGHSTGCQDAVFHQKEGKEKVRTISMLLHPLQPDAGN